MALVNKIKNIKNDLINVLNYFPMSILYLFMMSIVLIVFIFSEKTNYNLISALGSGLLLSIALELSFEYKLVEKKSNLLYLIPIVFSIICYSILAIFDNDYVMMAVGGGVNISLLSLIMYVLYTGRENKLVFSHLVKSKFITSLFADILISGIITCILAFNFLIFKFDDVWKIIGLFSVIIGFFGNYLLFLSYLPKSEEELSVPKIYRNIIHKALFYVYLLLIFILYLYILKTIIIHKMPVGRFNWFGCFSLLFYVIFYLSIDETDGKVQEKFKKYGALIMIPIIIMQSIGLYIRISSYGLTMLRYMSIICIIAAIIFMVTSLTKINIKKAFIGLIALSLLVTCTPLNVIDVPNRNQECILKNTLSEAGAYNNGKLDENVKIDKEYIPAITSSYEYLRDSMGKKSKFFEEFQNSKIMNNIDYDQYSIDNMRSYYYYADNLMDKEFDISGYNKVKKIEGESSKINKIDYTDFFLSLKEDDKKAVFYKTDDMLILFNDISYTFDEESQEFDSIYWNAYLFEK